jgi:single-strand DNA-binding protein
MNQVTLVGKVVASELRSTDTAQVLKLRIQTATAVPHADGRRVFRDYHNVAVWGQSAPVLAGELTTGDVVSVVGRLITRSYEKNGEKHYMTEVNAASVQP